MNGEFDYEPVRGLPAHLPPGEKVLWQGAPTWRSIARHAMHVPIIGAYLGAVLVWRIASGLVLSQSLATIGVSVAWLAVLGGATIGFLLIVARLVEHTTLYTITTHRVVMRIGVAFTISLNVPFRIIEAAAFRDHRDGTGDIPLQLNGEGRISYLHLWPHARPWKLARPEPMLRCVRYPLAASEVLAEALTAFNNGRNAAKQPLPEIVEGGAGGRHEPVAA
jgi:PH (Pleckstrin Homology) domain-containing protein